MTFEQTQRLCTMLHMNYASFMPKDLHEAAGKVRIWADAMKQVKPEAAEAAFRLYVKTAEFAPTIAEFLRFVRACDAGKKDQLLLEDNYKPEYTADPDHVERVFEQLMKDLS